MAGGGAGSAFGWAGGGGGMLWWAGFTSVGGNAVWLDTGEGVGMIAVAAAGLLSPGTTTELSTGGGDVGTDETDGGGAAAA